MRMCDGVPGEAPVHCEVSPVTGLIPLASCDMVASSCSTECVNSDVLGEGGGGGGRGVWMGKKTKQNKTVMC